MHFHTNGLGGISLTRRSKKRKKGRKTAWLLLSVFCLAAFILGYLYAVIDFSF